MTTSNIPNGACWHLRPSPTEDNDAAMAADLRMSDYVLLASCLVVDGGTNYDPDSRWVTSTGEDLGLTEGNTPWPAIDGAEWHWHHCPMDKNEAAMGADLVTRGGIILASCLVDADDPNCPDCESDGCGVTAEGLAFGLSNDTVDWPDDNDGRLAWKKI